MNKKKYESYAEISRKTRISEEWLRGTLTRELNEMFPGQRNIVLKDGERKVYLKNFKEWLKRNKIYPVPAMMRHLGMSPGQLSGLMRRNMDDIGEFFIPTLMSRVNYIRETDAHDFVKWRRSTKKTNPLAWPPGVCVKPEQVLWPEKAVFRVRRTPVPSNLKRLMVPPPEDKQTSLDLDPVEPPPPPLTWEEKHPTDIPPKDADEMGDVWKQVKELGKPRVIRYTKLELEY